MDAFRNTISRIGIENLRPPPGGRGSSSSASSSCPQSVNWSEFNSRLCGDDPLDLDGFCESLWSTTSDPDAAATSNDATSSFDVETDSKWSTTTLPDHRRQTSTILMSDVPSWPTHQQRVDNLTTGSFDAVPPSVPFFSYTSPPANHNSSSTANAQGHYVGGGANVPMVVACVLIIICFCSIILIIFLSSR